METIVIGDLGIPELAALAKVHQQTAWNWIVRGIKANGRRVRLAADKIGGHWRSDKARLFAFLEQTRGVPPADRPRPQTEKRRRKAVQRAIKDAKEMGAMTP